MNDGPSLAQALKDARSPAPHRGGLEHAQRAGNPTTGEVVPLSSDPWGRAVIRLRERMNSGGHLVGAHTGMEDLDFLHRLRGRLDTCLQMAIGLPENLRDAALRTLEQTEKTGLDCLEGIEDARQTLAECWAKDEQIASELQALGRFAFRKRKRLLTERVALNRKMVETMFAVERLRREALASGGNYLDLIRGMLPY